MHRQISVGGALIISAALYVIVPSIVAKCRVGWCVEGTRDQLEKESYDKS